MLSYALLKFSKIKSLLFIWHMTSNKTQVEFRRDVTCQFGHEYLSLVHDVQVLFMFFLMADLT